MRLLTLNIWNLFFSAHRTARMAAIATALREGPWDAVALQEMWPVPERAQFDACGYAHARDMEEPWSRPQNWLLAPAMIVGFRWILDSGLRTLSRWPIRETRALRYRSGLTWHRRLTHPETVVRKGALACLIETPHLGSVWLVNTHLVASTRHHSNNTERRDQLAQLQPWIAALLPTAPVVLAGDLNMGPPIPGSRAETDEPDFWDQMRAGPLADFQEAPEQAAAATWCDRANPYVAQSMDRESARLDHILAGPGLQACDGAVCLTEAVDLDGGARGPLSDHFGVEAVIKRDPTWM